jgi:hypothetical protein
MVKWKFIDEEMFLKKFDDFAYGAKNKDAYVELLADEEIRNQLK